MGFLPEIQKFVDDAKNLAKKLAQDVKSLSKSNKVYTQIFKDEVVLGNESAQVIKLFDPVTIQPNKKVRLDVRVPLRNEYTQWGGAYINLNVNVNNTWYNLGNTGHDGGVMGYGAKMIGSCLHQMTLDFVGNLSLDSSQPYTVQFEITGVAFQDTCLVNSGSHINFDGRTLNSRGNLQSWASDQNYCHIIITELDR